MPMNDAQPLERPAARKSLRRSLRAAVVAAGVGLAVFGCSGGYDIPPAPAGTPALQGDEDCQLDNEPSQGDACSQDCLTATCASGMGRRICTCEGGVFLQCACLPPENWPFKDVPTAPYCDTLTGLPKYLAGETCTDGLTCRSTTFPEQGCHCSGKIWQCGMADAEPANSPSCESFGNGKQGVLKDLPCDTEWQLCIARDYNPTGTSPRGCACLKEGAQLSWTCGATNRWYRAE